MTPDPAEPPLAGLLPGAQGAWIAILLLTLGCLAAGEYVLLRLRRRRKRPPDFVGQWRQRLCGRLLADLDPSLAAARFGWICTAVLLGTVGVEATATAGMPWRWITVLGLALGALLMTQIARKAVAARPAGREPWPAILPVFVLTLLMAPLLRLGEVVSSLTARVLRPNHGGDETGGEEELRSILTSSAGPELPQLKLELLDNVFELSHRTARQVMVPRADVVFLSTHRGLEENLQLARASSHTRFPLCDGNLDQVQGLVHLKDLFLAEQLPQSLTDIARPMTFVPESLTLDRLLRRMRREQRHLVAVVDEYGGVSGIVTMENVIEEIVGEIQDEFDLEGPELIRAATGAFQVVGSMLVEDLEEELEVEIGDCQQDTVGGAVLSRLGRSPELGDRAGLGPLEAEVIEIDGNRILQLRLRPRPAERLGTETELATVSR